MKLATLTALAVTAAAMLSNTTASAAATVTVTTYNGSYCKAYYGSQQVDFQYVYQSIYNISNTNRYIVCPVLLTDEFVNKGASVWVYWLANKSEDRLSCTFYSVRKDGAILQLKNSSKVGSGWLPDNKGPAFVISQDDNNYNMICWLPPFGRLTSIEVFEWL